MRRNKSEELLTSLLSGDDWIPTLVGMTGARQRCLYALSNSPQEPLQVALRLILPEIKALSTVRRLYSRKSIRITLRT